MWGTPPEPGTAELEPGEFLAYHYTSSDEALSSILREGVKLNTSERRPTEEAAAVWGSFERPQGFKRYVEFKVRREDMWVGQPSSDEDMARAAQMGHNFTMVKNEIPVDRITTWSSPEIEDVRVWQRELADATPEWKKSVLNGAYDGVPAVDKAKQVLAKEFGSPGWAEKPSGVTDDVAVKSASVPRVDTDRLQRRADRLRREIDDPDFVYPGARMGFRHRAAELTKIESELVKRGALEPEARRTSVVAALIELACRDASCAPPPVGTGGSKPGDGLTARVFTDEEFMSWGPHKSKVSFQGEDWMKSLEVGGINRKLLSKMVKGTAPEGSEAEQETIRKVVRWTQQSLKDAGVETVTLFRGGYLAGNPFDKTSSTRKLDDPTTSGVTSWSADPGGASSFRRKEGAAIFVAEVPVEHIVSWDMIGNVSSARSFYLAGGNPHIEFTGREVLVADSAHTVHRLLGGVTAAGCQSAECAPPPVGVGGSSPAQGLQSGSRARQVVVDTIEEIGEGSESSLKFGRQMLLARQKVRGFHQLSSMNADLDPAMEAEWKALSKAVPVQEGFVRDGTEAAAKLTSRIREVLPSAQVGWMDDVHAESVEAVLDGVALYPEEVRDYVQGVALGYTEAESHVAAFGPHGGGLMGPAAPGATLWLGPKAVRPSTGTANPDGASVMTTVDGFNRHRLVGAHEMGHVVHNMAAERAWKEDGIRVDLRADGYLPQDVPTTRYGGLDTGEMVAETFALAARDSFKSLEPLQQDVVVSVLDRAGLRPSDLAFAAATDEPYEVQFFGDDFGLEPEALPGRAGADA